jgi:DNA-binding MarR family transcriptional regulator
MASEHEPGLRPRKRLAEAQSSSGDALLAILETIPALFFKLKARTEALHAAVPMSTGERGVLRDLIAEGAMTAPQLAALRPVSRQAIQQILNRLAARGYAVPVPNPAHARSVLYEPTRAGRARLASMRRRERAAAAAVVTSFTARELEHVLATLRRLDGLLASSSDS